MDYRQAGVDVVAGRTFIDRIRSLVELTKRPEVLGGFGGFSGAFEIPAGYRQPVLISGTDGVGTKLKIAQACNRHDSIGIDLVAMCVNDILTSGAEPLFFLDYLATGKLEPDCLVEVVRGIAQGCAIAGCTLLGGETAEMPGFYQHGEYDLAGFAVGIVEKSQILDGSQVREGDVLIGLASSGTHSNGFSLIRKIVADRGWQWSDRPDFSEQTLGELFLTPTVIYVPTILAALRSGLRIHALAHITGGGIPENLPRCLGPGQSAQVLLGSWTIPPLFDWLARQGDVPFEEMLHTFNMGIGMVAVVAPDDRENALAYFESQGISANDIGTVVAGASTVELLGMV